MQCRKYKECVFVKYIRRIKQEDDRLVLYNKTSNLKIQARLKSKFWLIIDSIWDGRSEIIILYTYW